MPLTSLSRVYTDIEYFLKTDKCDSHNRRIKCVSHFLHITTVSKVYRERRKNCYDISVRFPHERFYLPQSVVLEYTEISPLTYTRKRLKTFCSRY